MRLLIGGAVLLAALVVGFNAYITDRVNQPVAVTTLDVPPGTPAHQVLKLLAPSLSNIERALIFRLHPTWTQLQAGRYAFVSDFTVEDALQAIHAGDAVRSRLTVPEGIRTNELLSRITQAADLDGPTPEGQALQQLLSPEYAHPEGAFLAETYVWKQRMDRSELLGLAHQALKEAVDSAWNARSEPVAEVLQTPYELLILASIVEKETAISAERPRIAGVFIERLRRGMRLQTDPTVIYGLGDNFDGNLTRQHLRQKTPYNTYRINGLPPTPIALVGPDALRAVSQPEITGELYFVADGQGAHVFSYTLQEHNANVRKYQLKR